MVGILALNSFLSAHVLRTRVGESECFSYNQPLVLCVLSFLPGLYLSVFSVYRLPIKIMPGKILCWSLDGIFVHF